MPTSEINSIPPILREVVRLQPRRVLDLGAGCGKYGVLVREYLDGAHGRTRSLSWQTRIDAVEGFGEYITDLHRSVYTSIHVEDFSQRYYEGYDVVLMIDSFEHLERETGLRVLDELLFNNKHVIVSVPQGHNFLEQGAVFGNEFERHRTNWDDQTFLSRGGRMVFREICTVWSIPGRSNG